MLSDKMPSLVNFFDAVEYELKENPSYFYLNSSLLVSLMDTRATNRNSVKRGAHIFFT